MDRLGVFPHGRDGRRQTMRTPDEVSTMQRLHELGWGTRRIAAEVGCNRETVQRYLAAGAWTPCRVPTRPACWRDRLLGCLSGCGVTGATRTWCARSWRPSWASWSACARWSGRCRICGASLRRRRWRRCGSRRRRAASCRSTSASAGSRSRARTRAACSCSWRRSATRGGFMRRPSGTSGNRRGWRGSRARSATSAACRASCCSTTPVPWSSTTTRLRGRWSSPTACTRSPGIGTCGRSPARPTGPAPRARTSAASATSSTTPSPGGALPRGARWRRIWPGGCARWPTRGCTARRARRRSCGSSARSGRRCAR